MGQVSKHSMGGVIQDVFGRHVNRAARIEAKAEPGHVLVSFNVYDCAVNWLKSTPIAWTHHGQVYLKGFAEPVSLHEPFEPGITSPQAGGVRLPTLLESLEQTLGADDTVTRDDKAAHTPMAAPDPLDVWFVNDPSIRRLGGAIARAIRQRRTGGGSVLWVDDHPENNVPLVSILERAGCSVECATSTEAAGRRLRTRQYSVIITDMGRGDDATAGLKLLAFREAHGIETPTIIYASSQAIANHGPKARELGAARCTAGAVSLIQHIHDAIAYPITFGREEWGAGQE